MPLNKFTFFVLFGFLTSCVTAPVTTRVYHKHLKVTKLVSVYDGDTIRVNIAGCHPLLCENISIRLYGIDTPEIRGKCKYEKQLAIQARNLVRELLNNAQTITLKNLKRGKYFRIVAEVYADKINISQTLIKQNLAYVYFGETKKKWC